jgi:hypothetical protein
MTTAQKLGGALGGVTSGFELAQGVMGSFGVESEEVEKALLKVQSAMAIAQGVQGFKEALPSIKALGSGAVSTFKAMTTSSKVFMLTGIGLVITAISAAISALDLFSDATKEAEKAQKKLEMQNELTAKSLESKAKTMSELLKIQTSLQEDEINNAKLAGASEEELTKIRKKQIDERIADAKQANEEYLKTYLEISKSGSDEEDPLSVGCPSPITGGVQSYI